MSEDSEIQDSHISEDEPKTNSEEKISEEKKKGGCLKKVIIGLIVVVVFVIIGSLSTPESDPQHKKDSSKKAENKPKVSQKSTSNENKKKEDNISVNKLAYKIDRELIPGQGHGVEVTWKQVFKQIQDYNYFLASQVIPQMFNNVQVNEKTRPHLSKLWDKLKGIDRPKNSEGFYKNKSIRQLATYIIEYLLPGETAGVESTYKMAYKQILLKDNYSMAANYLNTLVESGKDNQFDNDFYKAVVILFDKCKGNN